jgi:hypothetical protein
MRVGASIDLPVPAERAWAVLVRWEDQARWMRDTDRVEVLTPAREGLGVRLGVRTRVLGFPLFTEELEVTLWEPTARLVVEHRSFVRGRAIWALDPVETGCRFTWIEDLSLRPPALGELALRAYRPFMRRLMRGALAELRAYVIAS